MGKYQLSKLDKVPKCAVVFLNINNALYLPIPAILLN